MPQIVLIDGGPKLINDDEWSLGFIDLEGAMAWRKIVESDLDAAARSVVPQFFREPPERAELAWMLEETIKCDQAGLRKITWNVLNQDYRDVPEKIDVATLVVAGSHDTVIPAANARWLSDRIRGSRLVLFDRSSHCPFIEERGLFNQEIASFVAEK